jgi:hypothetical protein
MSSPQPPLTPRYRAVARMVVAWDLPWDEAEAAVEHTTTGAMVLLEEQVRELGRVAAKAGRAEIAAALRYARKVTRHT